MFFANVAASFKMYFLFTNVAPLTAVFVINTRLSLV